MEAGSQQMAKGQQQLTEEQLAVIRTSGDIAINAVAGSGKTTTIIEYAASRPSTASILYLAFNRSVKMEALRRFEQRGLRNVRVETAHSLAFDYIVKGSGYKVSQQEYRTHEIVEMLGLEGLGERHTEYIIASHISKFITYFCNSDKAKVQELNYLDTIADKAARSFAQKYYPQIEGGTRQLLAKMDRREIAITHDFYLKKFQLSAPQLPYDYILFDEAQDASAAMLAVFLQQKRAVKVIVGDTHQQIYGWRHAVNSLDRAEFSTLQLSASFRFPQEMAELATQVLTLKEKLYKDFQPASLQGKGKAAQYKTNATIARSNLGLLLNAIEYVTENRKVKSIYFEGNINTYTYADEGASLYDVLNLANNKPDKIRDKLIRSMNSLDDLEEYIEKTEDQQLAMMLEVVKEYGDGIYDMLRSLKDLHCADADKATADMIFSTVHRAKGMEYDTVYLVNDFINQGKIKKAKADAIVAKEPMPVARLNEEVNLLYVAITRAKSKLHIPDGLVPDGVPLSDRIVRVQAGSAETGKKTGSVGRSAGYQRPVGNKSYGSTDKRSLYADAGKYWTAAQDEELQELYETFHSLADIAESFGRTKGAIIARLKKLGLMD